MRALRIEFPRPYGNAVSLLSPLDIVCQDARFMLSEGKTAVSAAYWRTFAPDIVATK